MPLSPRFKHHVPGKRLKQAQVAQQVTELESLLARYREGFGELPD